MRISARQVKARNFPEFRVSGKRLAETSSGHNPLQTLKVKTVTKAKIIDKNGLVR